MLQHAAFCPVVFVLTLIKIPDSPRLVGRMYRIIPDSPRLVGRMYRIIPDSPRLAGRMYGIIPDSPRLVGRMYRIIPDSPRLVGRMYRFAGGIQAEANNPLVQNDNATRNYFF